METVKNICSICGEEQRFKLVRWFHKFLSRDFYLDNVSHSGRSKAICWNNLQSTITINRRITTRQPAMKFNVPQTHIVEAFCHL